MMKRRMLAGGMAVVLSLTLAERVKMMKAAKKIK